MSVLYEPGRFKGLETRAVIGTLEPTRALELLLRGSGLTSSLTSANVVSISLEHKGPAVGPEPPNLPTVRIVADSRSGSTSVPGVSVRTITSDELFRQGFGTIADWARAWTQNQGTGAYEGTSYLREAPTNIAYGSGLNLYGIGQRATVILVNGVRLAPSGSAGSFTDVMNLPLSAVDRIELKSAGASTIYGADAAGGVVNIILRDGYSRPLTKGSFGHLTKGDLADSDLFQSLVTAGDRSRALIAVDYHIRNGLPASDRRQATSNLTPGGGSNFDSLYGNPGNIVDSRGGLWGIPTGQNGTSLTANELLRTQNLYDVDAGTWILPRQELISALWSGSYDFSDGTQIFLDELVSRRRVKTFRGPLAAQLSVPSTNPYYVNPIPGNTQPITVLYAFGQDLGHIADWGTVYSGQIAMGLRRDWSSGWHTQLSGSFAVDNQLEEETNLVNFGALPLYLATGDRTIAFNPLGDGSNTNPDTLAAIRADGFLQYRSELASVNLEAEGSVASLPKGPLVVRTGFEFRRHRLRSAVSDAFNFAGQTLNIDRDRRLNAMYLQADAPVFSGRFAGGAPYQLALSGGWRFEYYNDAGSAGLPSLGFRAKFSDVELIASWTRTFRPPNLPDLDEAIDYAQVSPMPDPKSKTGYTQTLIWGGNNAGLSPETARVWMAGLQFSPLSISGLSLELQYYNIVSSHQVVPGVFPTLALLSDPQYSYLVTRDITAPHLAYICSHSSFIGVAAQCLSPDIGAILDLRLRSAETVKTDGFDLRGQYGLDTRLGRFNTELQSTYVLHFAQSLAPEGAWVNFRNTPHNPLAIRVRGVLGWEKQQAFASTAFNLKGRYKDNFSVPERPVSAWLTWDLTVGYRFRPSDEAKSGHTMVALHGLNIFNEQPPFLDNAVGVVGYDPENADLLGRRVSLSIEHEW